MSDEARTSSSPGSTASRSVSQIPREISNKNSLAVNVGGGDGAVTEIPPVQVPCRCRNWRSIGINQMWLRDGLEALLVAAEGEAKYPTVSSSAGERSENLSCGALDAAPLVETKDVPEIPKVDVCTAKQVAENQALLQQGFCVMLESVRTFCENQGKAVDDLPTDLPQLKHAPAVFDALPDNLRDKEALADNQVSLRDALVVLKPVCERLTGRQAEDPPELPRRKPTSFVHLAENQAALRMGLICLEVSIEPESAKVSKTLVAAEPSTCGCVVL